MFIVFCIKNCKQTRDDPDQVLHFVAYDLNLHYLHMSPIVIYSQNKKLIFMFPLDDPSRLRCIVRTTRPEKCDIFAERYQSQPITTKFQKHC